MMMMVMTMASGIDIYSQLGGLLISAIRITDITNSNFELLISTFGISDRPIANSNNYNSKLLISSIRNSDITI